MKRFSKIFAGALAVMMIMCSMMPLMVFADTTVTVQGKDVNKLASLVTDPDMQDKYGFDGSGNFKCTGEDGTHR